MRLSHAFIGLSLLTVAAENPAGAIAVVPKIEPLAPNSSQLAPSPPVSKVEQKFLDLQTALVPEELHDDIGKMLGITDLTHAAFRQFSDSYEIYGANDDQVRILSINPKSNLLTLSQTRSLQVKISSNGKTYDAVSNATQIFNCAALQATGFSTTFDSRTGIPLFIEALVTPIPPEAIKGACAGKDEILDLIKSGLSPEK